MIESLRAKEHLTFKNIDVTFNNGLIVFTGASGSGKSVFFSALLSVFGFVSNDATMLEASVDNVLNIDEFGIENDEINIFKSLKQKSVRYYINTNQISQKNLKQISQRFISYLSIRDSDEFDSSSIINLIDMFIEKDTPSHIEIVKEFKDDFDEFTKVRDTLLEIENKEKKVEELKEFAKFEIEKIEEISPKIGEDIELMEFKKRLSKKDKILSALDEASNIFESESAVSSALELLDEKSELFDETMNFLRALFENERDKLDELDEVDIENVLDRIEKISSLKNRFGTIEECLTHLEKRKDELKHYENITFEKNELQKKFIEISNKLRLSTSKLSNKRLKALKPLTQRLNYYAKELYLEDIFINSEKCEISKDADIKYSIVLNNTDIKKISSGEYNRLRLAFIALKNELKSSDGILILDEVDSNLSGKESMSVANILKKISKNYQIFAISHHPQLSSVANQHFSIYKQGDESFIKELNEDERIEELSRMISGESINNKAREFAKELRKSNL